MENISEIMQKIMDKKGLTDRYQRINSKVLNDTDIQYFLNQHQSELTRDAINRSFSKLYEYYDVKMKIEKGESSFAPGYLPELVVNDHLIDISYAASPERIKKQAADRIEKRISMISMPKDIKSASLESFDQNSNRFSALSRALEFINTINEKQFTPGLYIYGPFGVGKTYLLGAIANELAKLGKNTTLVHFPSFAVEMKSAINDNSVMEKINAVKKSSILMLDDIGADSMSSWIRDEVLGVILEYRMQQKLPTFFSSNFSMEQLENEHLSINQKGELEPLKAKRLMQRIRFLSREVIMDGENRREIY